MKAALADKDRELKAGETAAKKLVLKYPI